MVPASQFRYLPFFFSILWCVFAIPSEAATQSKLVLPNIQSQPSRCSFGDCHGLCSSSVVAVIVSVVVLCDGLLHEVEIQCTKEFLVSIRGSQI